MIGRVLKIIKLTFPILLGYLSVGFIYGLFARSAGFETPYIIATSLFLFAGASQFLLINLLRTGSGVSQIFAAVFLLNLRHIFYYRPVKEKFPTNFLMRAYSIFSLTDESFAVLTESAVTKDEGFQVLLFDQGYWVLGTTIGAMAAGWMGTKIEGLDFSLVALFIVLMVEKINWKKDWSLLLLNFSICLGVWNFMPSNFFLILSMGTILITITLRDRTSFE